MIALAECWKTSATGQKGSYRIILGAVYIAVKVIFNGNKSTVTMFSDCTI